MKTGLINKVKIANWVKDITPLSNLQEKFLSEASNAEARETREWFLMAINSGAFDFLKDEPDLYSLTDGKPC